MSTSYLENRILEGEHQQQDFKYAITDSKKIARSLAAFANTDGGRLLVGVKDNGNIAGVSSDEEYYMIEGSATRYCSPPVGFSTREWKTRNGKTVLEIIIPKSTKKPHSAPTKEGKMMVYIRVNDQNLLANKILLKVWERQKQDRGSLLKLTGAEQWVIDYLNKNETITLSRFRKQAKIPYRIAENILINLVSMQIVQMEFTEKQVYYHLNNEQPTLNEPNRPEQKTI